jgi:hypothetical protein
LSAVSKTPVPPVRSSLAKGAVPAAGVKLSLGAKTGKLAQVFNPEESSDEEEIPPEARYDDLPIFFSLGSLLGACAASEDLGMVWSSSGSGLAPGVN